MKRLFLLTLALCFTACSSSRKPVVITTKKEARKAGYPLKRTSPETNPFPTASPEANPSAAVFPETTTSETISSKAQDIIDTALSYNGTPYKYSGVTKNGMDCSGLVYTSFTEHDITLERSSRLMARQGKRIKLSQVRPGDLVFFITDTAKNRINHVGLVIETNGDDIRFIHATTSKGVLISSINEEYWDKAFVEARKIL